MAGFQSVQFFWMCVTGYSVNQAELDRLERSDYTNTLGTKGKLPVPEENPGLGLGLAAWCSEGCCTFPTSVSDSLLVLFIQGGSVGLEVEMPKLFVIKLVPNQKILTLCYVKFFSFNAINWDSGWEVCGIRKQAGFGLGCLGNRVGMVNPNNYRTVE